MLFDPWLCQVFFLLLVEELMGICFLVDKRLRRVRVCLCLSGHSNYYSDGEQSMEMMVNISLQLQISMNHVMVWRAGISQRKKVLDCHLRD